MSLKELSMGNLLTKSELGHLFLNFISKKSEKFHRNAYFLLREDIYLHLYALYILWDPLDCPALDCSHIFHHHSLTNFGDYFSEWLYLSWRLSKAKSNPLDRKTSKILCLYVTNLWWISSQIALITSWILYLQ